MVSVCMATHNGAQFLREQIDSILPQLHSNDEFVFSDDNSSDETLAILAGYHEPRFRILINRFGSPLKNFECALQQSKGDQIFLADQDDVWSVNKIHVMKEALTSVDLVLSDCAVANEVMEILHPSFFAINGSRPGLLQNLWHNAYIGCCMAFNRKVLEAALPFPATVPAHDMWLGLVAERSFKVRFLEQPLVRFRRHAGSFSTTAGESRNNLSSKITQRWSMARALINH